MYAIATCRVTITRGVQVNTDEFGDPVRDTQPVYSGPANIQESAANYTDRATQTPRTVRSLTMLVSAAADVRSGDYVHDDTFDVAYVAQVVSRDRGPLYTPDLSVNLKRVG